MATIKSDSYKPCHSERSAHLLVISTEVSGANEVEKSIKKQVSRLALDQVTAGVSLFAI